MNYPSNKDRFNNVLSEVDTSYDFVLSLLIIYPAKKFVDI